MALERGGFASVAAGITLFALLLSSCDRNGSSPVAKPEAQDAITIGLITDYAGQAPIYTALAKGYFDDAGLKVTVHFYSSGKVALDNLIDGKVDIATAAELPITLAVLRGHPISILATVATGEDDYGLVGLRDKGITSPSDLKGKRIAVTLGTSGDFFLDSLLIRQRLSRTDVQLINRKPQEMANALANGEADAVAIWEPYISALHKQMGDKVAVFYSGGIYDSTLDVVATREFTSKRAETIKKFLRALSRAEQLYASDREAVEKIVADALKIGPAETKKLLSKHRFSLSLDQSLVAIMEDQSRWAIKNKLVDGATPPNFLDNMYFAGLLAIKPKAVTAIH